jgi:hypothetical protein
MNILVEKKKEFTIRIINILSPLIFEGLESIYNKAKEISTGDNVLKIFQSFLKRIPKWEDELLLQEINRIKTNSKDFQLLYDLIRACVKANIHILTYSPNQTSKFNIKPEDYKSIDFQKFIHNIYIECAREVWNNPYLFYHNYTGIEIKRNQRDTIQLIKVCIEESIRKTLPLKHVLEIYLGDELVDQVPDDNFERTITEVDEKNLKQLLKQELNYQVENKPDINCNSPIKKLEFTTKPHENNINQIDQNKQLEVEQILPMNIPKNDNVMSNFISKDDVEKIEEQPKENKITPISSILKRSKSSSSELSKSKSSLSKNNSSLSKNNSSTDESFRSSKKEQVGGDISSNKDLNSKILGILDNKNINLSDNLTSEKKIEKKKKLSETSSEDLISNTMDSNLRKILKDDLANSETESSVNFKPEVSNSNYQEIFSNSNVENSTNSQQKNEEVSKNKFFNNYLQF